MADNEQEVSHQNQENNDQSNNTLQQMQQQIDQCITDPQIIAQIKQDLDDLNKDLLDCPELEMYKIKYDNLHNALIESYKNEQHFIKQCKDHALELTSLLAKLDGVNKMIQANEENLLLSKNELNRIKRSIEDQKLQKVEIEEKIKNSKEEQVELSQKTDERLKKVDQENAKVLITLRQAKEDIEKLCEVQAQRIKYLQNETTFIDEEVLQEEKINAERNQSVQEISDEIRDIKEKTVIAEKKRDEMQREIDEIKEKIDLSNEEFDKKKEILRQLNDKYECLPQRNKELQAEKDEKNEEKKQSEKSIKDKRTEIEEKQDRQAKLEENIKNLEMEIEVQQQEKIQLERKCIEQQKEDKIIFKKLNKILTERDKLIKDEEHKQFKDKEAERNVEEKKKIRDKNKEQIDNDLRGRSNNNKELKKAEDEQHEMQGELIYGFNKVRKIENQVLAYQQENEKLRKMITQLQKEQEKYGIEASQAHAKYYQTIEEVKIKNNQITELQKKNAEVEAKLKHQQNLYEAVRSDRNLYSKNLLESQEEIDELQKKYTRMTHQVDQFKEEIKSKDGALVKEDFEFNKIVEENKTTKLQKKRVKKAIKSTEEVIKSQEGHISRLKYVIQEAKQEKQRNTKDLDMVINERDILGTQLIKRNHELNVLYEKIKLSQSNLAKGEIFYREKQKELDTLKNELTLLINELKGTQEQISCIDELKAEINSLEKDILQAKTKVKALQDELENPLNVHRWRKLEATDQDLFEKILKIQTLQRRLIAKTEEVKEKDNLIKEKEKLFMELKNILARQPGVEIHSQLAQYKESLKEKQGQMKKMNAELKNAQENVDLLKFENNRLRSDIAKMKQQYFKQRKLQDKASRDQTIQEQQIQAPAQGIIYDQNNPAHNPDLQQNQMQIGGGVQ